MMQTTKLTGCVLCEGPSVAHGLVLQASVASSSPNNTAPCYYKPTWYAYSLTTACSHVKKMLKLMFHREYNNETTRILRLMTCLMVRNDPDIQKYAHCAVVQKLLDTGEEGGFL